MDVSDLRRRADEGSVVASGLLGLGYLYGDGCEVNYEEAFRYLSFAASRGASRPTAGLARIYEFGLGVARDVPTAVSLYERVADVEFDAAIALVRLYSQGEGFDRNAAAASHWYSVAASIASDPKWADEVAAELAEARTFLAKS